MKPHDVLIINSYAGSLTLGATAVGLPIRASYEDAGFGLGVQMTNFPDLEYRPTYADWPDTQDLQRTVVLAHPPCSAFSNQTPRSGNRKGTGSDAFACTKQVLRYAMGNDAAAIAVESVPAALAGAAQVHESYARRYGYHLYRVLQNAVSFGVPQWRPRFWAVFVREGVAPAAMLWTLPHKGAVTVRDVLDEVPAEPVLPDTQRRFDLQRQRLIDELDLTPKAVDTLLREETGQLHNILTRRFFPDLDPMDVKRQHCGNGFVVKVLRLLDPDGFATTLLADSYWAYQGRPVSLPGYCALMGFPPDYVFPDRERTHARMYLSKGVCPPVATWVLDTIVKHLSGANPLRGQGYTQPGQTADFNLKRKDYMNREAA